MSSANNDSQHYCGHDHPEFPSVVCDPDYSIVVPSDSCSCSEHRHYDVSWHKLVLQGGEDIEIHFLKPCSEIYSHLQMMSMDDIKCPDENFVMGVSIPDEIDVLECPDNMVCKHFHVHVLGTIFQTVYFTCQPAPMHPGLWWLTEITTHTLPQELVDVENNRCHNISCKRNRDTSLPDDVLSPLKKIRVDSPAPQQSALENPENIQPPVESMDDLPDLLSSSDSSSSDEFV
jgi:hypothetical protein